MKKRCLLLLMAVLCLLALAGCRSDNNGFGAFEPSLLDDYRGGKAVRISPEADVSAFRTVLDNGTWELLYHDGSAEIACRHQPSGRVFRSNAPGWGKEKEGAQLLLTLANAQGTQFSWNSLTDAAAYGQVTAKEADGALEVTYYFGKTSKVYAVPQVMTVEAFEAVLAKVEKTSDQSTLKRLYSYLELKDSDLPQTRATLLERFPVLESMPVYALAGSPSKLEISKLEKIFDAIGYTLEQKYQDEAACEHMAADKDELHAAVTLRYTLTDQGLRAEIPFDGLLVSPGAKVVDITLLPYFGMPMAGEQGCAVIPDGCGALLDLRTPRNTGYPAYSARVYGTDDANQITDRAAPPPVVTLPVFGVRAGEQAFAAVITDGAPFAFIVADAPRTDGSLGYAGVRFLYMETAYFSLDAKPENRILCYQPQANRCDMAVEYRLLPEGPADASAIALSMKQGLEEAGLLTGTSSGELPLTLETIGAIDVEELVLGVPVTRIRPLTTYAQTADMALTLHRTAGSGLRVIAGGALKGGVRCTRQTAVTAEGALGGRKGLAALRDTLAAQGIPFAVANDIMLVHKDGWLDGFSVSGDTARLLTSTAAYKPDYTLSTMYMTSKGMAAYMLDREAILEGLSAFDRSAGDFGLDAVALPSLGSILYSDMRDNGFVSRDEMRRAIQTAMGALETKAWLRGGNAYALPGAILVYDLPLHASAHPLLGEEIPLAQMILSGHVDYAATSMQYAADERGYLLRCIAYGSGLYAQVYAESGAAVKYTDFDDLYAGSYPLMAQRLEDGYAQLRSALADTAGKAILHHSRQGNVTRTLYENGVAVYVNEGGEANDFTAPDGTRVSVAPYAWTTRKEALQ